MLGKIGTAALLIPRDGGYPSGQRRIPANRGGVIP
jgi:hypothetical protein